MRHILGEIALYAAICAIGIAGVFVWREHPIIAILLVLALATLVAWVGYRMEKVLRPEGGHFRRVLAAALTVGGVGLGAYVLWISICSCT